ncbi:MAG: 50S ribosomal protein L34e [Candidatus Aenigmarchaeota archaeon]|nr:50S ribosomal protein L34e [Candidatus Aenigmarchaeota archaeon]
MTKTRFRSGSWTKSKVKTPGNKIVTHYSRQKLSAMKCAKCKKPLHGVGRYLSKQWKKLSKTEKRPERPYGGQLCSACMRQVFREKVLD